jgi:hypothetical protein
MLDEMDDRERNIFDMFHNTDQFDLMNSADYAEFEEAAAQFAIVRDVISKLEDYAEAKVSGKSGQAVELKSVIRLAMRRKMKNFAKTGRAVNISNPGVRKLFVVPDDNDDLLIATAREFVNQATENFAAFKKLGITQTKIDALTADADAFEAAMDSKAGANIESVGATAGIDQQIDRGMNAEIVLDAIMNNVYDDNPVKLAEWKSARHVRKRKSTPPSTEEKK